MFKRLNNVKGGVRFAFPPYGLTLHLIRCRAYRFLFSDS